MEKTAHGEILGLAGDLERLSEMEARRTLERVYADGLVSRQEANAVFDLGARLNATGGDWDPRLIKAVVDHVLQGGQPFGWVSDAQAAWLTGRLLRGPQPLPVGAIALLTTLLRRAEGAPLALSRFALEAQCTRIKAAGRIDEADVERLRSLVFASAGEGAVWVSRHEASTLFALNDTLAEARNAPAWNDFFARAIANHLLALSHPDPDSESGALSREAWLMDRASPGSFLLGLAAPFGPGWFERVTYSPERARAARAAAVEAARGDARRLDRFEAAWLRERLGWDKAISPAERALITFLQKEVPGFTAGLTAAA